MEQFISKIPAQYSIPMLSGILGLGLGLLSAGGERPRSEICAPEREALELCNLDLSAAAKICAGQIARAQDACVESQRALCDEKVSTLSGARSALDCAICRAECVE